MSEKWGIARGAEKMSMADDELVHWKYIKREKKPDGSYRYYYDKTSTTKGKIENGMVDELKRKMKAESSMAKDDKYISNINSGRLDNKYSSELARDQERKFYENCREKANMEAIYGEMNYLTLKAAQKKYSKTLRYKIDGVIEKMSRKTATFLTQQSIKINKAKTWFNNLFVRK